MRKSAGGGTHKPGMARQRRHVEKETSSHLGKHRGEPSAAKTSGLIQGLFSKYALLALLCSILVAFGVFNYYLRWLEARISMPLNGPKAVLHDESELTKRYWGSYRPGVYFGMKTRSPNSPVVGLMWFEQKIVNNQLPIRHACEMGDFDQRYTWLEHDGENFGIQEIHDGGILLKTSFVKRPGGLHGGEWTARITATATKKTAAPSPLSLLFYLALDGEGHLEPRTRSSALDAVIGATAATGAFQLSFRSNGSNILMSNYLSTLAPGLEVLKETVLNSLAYFSKRDGEKYVGLAGDKFPADASERRPNFVVHQATVTLPFEMEVVYESSSVADRPGPLTGGAYDASLARHSEAFHRKFHQVFGISAATYSEGEVTFAKAAFSNLLGGMGYFYGHSVVQSRHNKEPVPYFQSALYTAVPSRSFFPRGFLWDEGFHQLLVGRWSAPIAEDVVAHWLDAMNAAGWIPREQILDDESRARVPAEFVVQRDTNANPPTLFLPLKRMLQQGAPPLGFLKRIFPRLQSWFQWFNTTQVGQLPGSYRWQGRSNRSAEELNPITLASGLDDYPRASHPSQEERHVDLRCWMALAAGVMAEIAAALGESGEEYASSFAHLTDNRLLDELHWSKELQTYADYGLHTDKVRLEKPKLHPPAPGVPPPNRNPVRVYAEEPRLRFVNAHGYVSLFPFLLQVIDPSSEKLGLVLDALQQPDLLWSDYGLRSLATKSPLYRKPNTPSSPPYWRGPIWINMNYMAVEALRYYSSREGPHRQRAQEVLEKLRKNLITNMYKEYVRTGYLWEQYDDKTGYGQRAHPFTGWSALITLIMADV